jgi:hypothetical protein
MYAWILVFMFPGQSQIHNVFTTSEQVCQALGYAVESTIRAENPKLPKFDNGQFFACIEAN